MERDFYERSSGAKRDSRDALFGSYSSPWTRTRTHSRGEIIREVGNVIYVQF